MLLVVSPPEDRLSVAEELETCTTPPEVFNVSDGVNVLIAVTLPILPVPEVKDSVVVPARVFPTP